MVYLDYNASTPLRPGVAERVAEALAAVGNPSSVHHAGRRARALVEAARRAVGEWVAMPADSVVFCSGASEANNLAIHAALAGGCRHLLVSAIEHESVWAAAARSDTVVEQIAVDHHGRIDLAALAAGLARASAPALVAVMLANNETGVVQPAAEVAALARRYGARVLCDAVQAAARIAIDQRGLGADYLVLSGHKLGGPQGVGALVMAGDVAPVPLIRGGGQERGWRGGTENVPGIAGLAAALAAAGADLDAAAAFARLRDRLEGGVIAGAEPGRVTVHGAGAERLATTSCFSLAGVRADTQVMALDLDGFCVSAGAACSSG
ncbi:MAG: aminotransferase class V-fold PLP-dependent enzyme, partial [Alphaproteobacteria bacterium]|nr:aminotransferase class V-fold PLP-dependent enzyme [Alphaproteobacteria bacterium]